MSLQDTIAAVSEGFATVQGLAPSGPAYAKLCAILDSADNEAPAVVYKARIRFVSSLALNRLIRRGVNLESLHA